MFWAYCLTNNLHKKLIGDFSSPQVRFSAVQFVLLMAPSLLQKAMYSSTIFLRNGVENVVSAVSI